MHVAGVFVSCMSSVPRAFMRTPNSRAALTIHAKLFTFTRVKRVHARVCTHACVKFKVSGTVRLCHYIILHILLVVLRPLYVLSDIFNYLKIGFNLLFCQIANW